MASYRLTSKGQVTIPKEHRDAIGLRPGDPVQFELAESGDRIVIMRTEYQDPKDHPLIKRLRSTKWDFEDMSTDEYMQFIRGGEDE